MASLANRGIVFCAGFTSLVLVIELLQHAYALRRTRVLGAWAAGKKEKPLFVCRDGGLGDILCTFPAVEALAARQPGRPIAYICHRTLVAVPRLCPVVSEVFSSRCNDLVARYLSRKWEVFAPRYHDETGSRRPDSPESLHHEICRLAGVDPVAAPPLRARAPQLSAAAVAWLAEARRPGQRLVALHAGPTARARCWPEGHWGSLVSHCARTRPDLRFVQVGPQSHFQKGTLDYLSIPGALDARSLPSHDSLGLIAACDGFVGIDSGLLHAALAFAVPSVGLFGPTLAARRLSPAAASLAVSATGVDCLGCHHRSPRQHWDDGCPFSLRCMQALQPEAVAARLSALLPPRP